LWRVVRLDGAHDRTDSQVTSDLVVTSDRSDARASHREDGAVGDLVPARKHSVEEIVATLREMERLTDDGMSVSAAAKTLGITDQTFYRWRARYGSLPEDEAKRLQVLDDENARLKRVIAEQSQDISMLQDLTQGEILSAARRREAVEYLVHHYRISERRACRLVGQHRSTQRYGGTLRSHDGLPGVKPAGLASFDDGVRAFGAVTGGVPGQGWRATRKEVEQPWGVEDTESLGSEAVEGPHDEPLRPAVPLAKIPFVDDRIPCLYRLRTSLMHDLAWLTRDSEMARLVGSRAVVHRLSNPSYGLAHLFRGRREEARA